MATVLAVIVLAWAPTAFVPRATEPRPNVCLSAGAQVLCLMVGLASLYGLACSISAFRRSAPGSRQRRRALLIAVAFGVRDGVFGLALVLPAIAGNPNLFGGYTSQTVRALLPFAATALVVPLMAYAILRSQVLDIDIKVRWTLKQGTLAATFLAVFVVAGQMAESFAERYLAVGGWWVGGAAAGMLRLALTPLQRAAERVSRAAMPGTVPLREMDRAAKLALFEEQVRIAWEDGAMNAKERRLLANARDRLGICAE